MISTHFKGTEVFLVVGNHEFQIKVSPRALELHQDAPQHCAELLYEKLMDEIRPPGAASSNCAQCHTPQTQCAGEELCCADCTHLY